MNKKNLFPILFCIIFISLIWTITNFYSDILTSQLSTLKELQKKTQITQSFANQKSPAELAKRLNEFIPETLDKGAITNELTQFARDANIEISSISVDGKVATTQDTDSSNTDNTTINTLKSESITLKIIGGKREIYTFLQKLTQSKRYIGINTITLSFTKGLDNIEGVINVIIYYK
jgi:hypothetical protein